MSSLIRKTRSDVVFDIVNYTLLVLVFFIIAYPLYFVVIASFSDPYLVTTGQVWFYPKGLNLDAYAKVFAREDIMIGYRNTIIYTFFGTLLNLVMTIIGAYPLSLPGFKGKNLIMMMMMVTMFFSGGLIPTYLVYKQIGLINSPLVMIIPGAVSVYNLIIVRTFFQNSIPFELQEAARIDGCNNFQILTRIVIPLSKPILAVMVIFYGVGHWNQFFEGLIYLTNQNYYPLQLILRALLIVNADVTNGAAGDAEELARKVMLAESIKYSVIIVSSVPVMILYPFMQKYFVKGVMIGAVKG